jgi:hypothetical protein
LQSKIKNLETVIEILEKDVKELKAKSETENSGD